MEKEEILKNLELVKKMEEGKTYYIGEVNFYAMLSDIIDFLKKFVEILVNPKPYKFEELKKGMWVWDDKQKCCIQCNPKISEEFGKCINYISFAIEDIYREESFINYIEFEEGRYFPNTKALTYQEKRDKKNMEMINEIKNYINKLDKVYPDEPKKISMDVQECYKGLDYIDFSQFGDISYEFKEQLEIDEDSRFLETNVTNVYEFSKDGVVIGCLAIKETLVIIEATMNVEKVTIKEGYKIMDAYNVESIMKPTYKIVNNEE